MHLPHRSSRRGLLARALAVTALAALALPVEGCASVAGVQDVSIDFQVLPPSNGRFFGWTEISIDPGPVTVNSATLVAVTLDVERPEGTPDLSFLKDLRSEVVLGDMRAELATAKAFPVGEQAVPLAIKFHGDLQPFFKDNRVRLEWTGSTNPAFTKWPADGFWVRGRVKVELD